MRLSLFQPDIPQNLGATIRLAACFGVPLEIIEPCGFPLSDRNLRRAALDYGPKAELVRRSSWTEFMAAPERQEGRLVLFTTAASNRLHDFAFAPGDTLLFGRESAGVPPEIHDAADTRLSIPIRPDTRSLNLVTACAVGLAEALRQVRGFPSP